MNWSGRFFSEMAGGVERKGGRGEKRDAEDAH